MTQREIGPTGPAHEIEFELPSDVREHLETIVERHFAHVAALTEFVDRLEHAARLYMGLDPLSAEARPRRVREELRKAHKASVKLVERMEALGGVSRHILYAEAVMGPSYDFLTPLYAAREHLARAVELAKELPSSGGRPRRFADLEMARYVAHLVKTELDVEPNSGVGGLYEQIMKVLMAAVKRDHDDPYVHDLILAALNTPAFEQADGVILLGREEE